MTARFTRRQKRDAILREIKMRKRVYPSQIRQERMTQEEADHEIDVMEAIAADYAEPDLFGGAR
ncbi:hypothetical protein [Jannaschia formosa]|uniref:hypothetical protein n=1 Tax=Jannaschia formosa TaxID=2259592 RepID=UPI000E1B7F07|nr:hypothetical protein [Jannaschia formosa]TFL16400.1 hypothetical protein DR046_19960 [Jannaschia formosa]